MVYTRVMSRQLCVSDHESSGDSRITKCSATCIFSSRVRRRQQEEQQRVLEKSKAEDEVEAIEEDQ